MNDKEAIDELKKADQDDREIIIIMLLREIKSSLHWISIAAIVFVIMYITKK